MLRALVPGAEWEVASAIREWHAPTEAVETLMAADAVVVAFPLYVDGLPGSLMAFLERFGAALRAEPEGSRRKRRLYGAANCGFYEGKQNEVALEMLGHFADAHGLEWSGGIGIGTGEMIREMKSAPPDFFMRRPVTDSVSAFAAAIADGRRFEGSVFTQHGIPRWLFTFMGERGWRGRLRESGKKAREINARPLAAR